jgi:hypothetical protein
MRLVHFSHRGTTRFGILLSDERVLDLTPFFPNEEVFRSAGEEGMLTLREAVDRATHGRNGYETLYSLDEIILENLPAPPAESDPVGADGDGGAFRFAWDSGFGINLVQKVRGARR